MYHTFASYKCICVECYSNAWTYKAKYIFLQLPQTQADFGLRCLSLLYIVSLWFVLLVYCTDLPPWVALTIGPILNALYDAFFPFSNFPNDFSSFYVQQVHTEIPNLILKHTHGWNVRKWCFENISINHNSTWFTLMFKLYTTHKINALGIIISSKYQIIMYATILF